MSDSLFTETMTSLPAYMDCQEPQVNTICTHMYQRYCYYLSNLRPALLPLVPDQAGPAQIGTQCARSTTVSDNQFHSQRSCRLCPGWAKFEAGKVLQ